MREKEPRLPDPRASKGKGPATHVAWRGTTVQVTRRGKWWCITRGDRVWPGPAIVAGEPWPSTQDRIRDWLDRHQVLE